ncbi:D-alanyl-D-alanine carboxypeptidase family protein [Thalassobacillus pellis]|uniref:D-alanyl-D-alanine carboxypeptidase family protein n=1 Tax=Thalassobacillus pellis TaxID=748008 RepID=UPI001EF8C20D|nr:D-alanyl-D-alanine carboxypeptidase family protein [Thalassobacillus pellis]MBM7552414.1 D-alanyl-D-alanine carboxypeptidase [Thalassobacillus pellis]
MKKWLGRSSIICFLFISLFHPNGAEASIGVSANNAVLMDMQSGRVLFQKNAHDQELIASTTKIMTALLAVESGRLDEKVKASYNAVHTEGSSIYLKEGEKMTLKDLVYGLMLRSGNDAAMAIAEHLGGSKEGFAFLMNEKAAWLGMNNSHFDNPHGLDSDTHYSTAYDLALLMSYAMRNDNFREVTGAERYLSDNRDYYWFNKNKLLTKYYEYCTGGKTGFTKAAGRTLVSTAKKGKMELVAVTLNASSDWNDHQRMFEWGFKNYEQVSIQEEGKVPLELEGTGNLYFTRDVIMPVTEKEKEALSSKLKLYPPTADELAGKHIVYLNNEPILETAVLDEPFTPTLVDHWIRRIHHFMGISLW